MNHFEHAISITDKDGKEVAYIDSDPSTGGPITDVDRVTDICYLAMSFLPIEGQPYGHCFISRGV